MITLHNVLRRSLAVFVTCLLLLTSRVAVIRGQDVSGNFVPEKLERITQLIKNAVDEKRIAGGTALIARRGKIA